MIAIETRIVSGGQDEDRVLVERLGSRLVVVVADGAGGVGGGALAAQAVCDSVLGRIRDVTTPGRLDWVEVLKAADVTIEASGGLSTAVVVEIWNGEVRGASVGDSGAWIVTGDDILDLTEHQVRKPLLGSGMAVPVSFGAAAFTGRLLAATDGLFKYAPYLEIAACVRAGTLSAAASALIQAVRLPNGDLFDDVALALCERAG